MIMMDTQTSPDCFQKEAGNEFNEKTSIIQEDINHLKKWLAKQPHLHAKEDDHRLLSFLRGTKYSLERAKEKMELFYTARTFMSEIFFNRDPFLPEIQELLRLGYVIPLPTLNDKGERIILFRAIYDPSKTKQEHVFKTVSIFVDILLNEDDNFVIAGYHSIVDLNLATMDHCTVFSPGTTAKFIKIFREAYPLRIKGVHFIGTPSFFDFVYSLFKNAFSEKLLKRITFASGLCPESKDLPLKLLPKEYGGEAESIDVLARKWKEKVESYREWLIEESKYRSIEEKRVEKLRNTEKLFGTDGSFRKLEVD